RLVEVAHEGAAAQLAVREDGEPGLPLPLQQPQDLPILERTELLRGHGRVGAGAEQLRRAQQAAHMIGTVPVRHDVHPRSVVAPSYRDRTAYGGLVFWAKW